MQETPCWQKQQDPDSRSLDDKECPDLPTLLSAAGKEGYRSCIAMPLMQRHLSEKATRDRSCRELLQLEHADTRKERDRAVVTSLGSYPPL